MPRVKKPRRSGAKLWVVVDIAGFQACLRPLRPWLLNAVLLTVEALQHPEVHSDLPAPHRSASRSLCSVAAGSQLDQLSRAGTCAASSLP
jgi:hypothetical protein